ncbi:MAG: ABC transporter permease [Deferribacteraceae bacterium]|nr:ABC transporter permease [Deferribacteraceae bacterium]
MKRLILLFSQASAVLRAYKSRTAIAIIGVLLGAMALVIVQNVSNSLQKKVEDDIKAVGDRVIPVFARVPRVPGSMLRRQRVKTMRISDATAILSVNRVISSAPLVRNSYNVKYTNATIPANILGTTEEYFTLRGLSLADGRIFDNVERVNREKVVVIGSEVATDLFATNSPLGATIIIGTMSAKVIGVLNEKGADSSGNSMDNIIIMPVETAMERLMNRDYLNEISVQIADWSDYTTVVAGITSLLRIEHRITDPSKSSDFDIVNPVDEQKMSTTLIGLASLLGSASAGIAFFIGAVGIFSLMLLIVNQRTTEIGIKRAIGATKRDILFQFLLESGYIGVVGGVLGIVVGCILSLVVCYFAKLPYTISAMGALVGFVAAVLSGVLAGLYPALKASRVVPVKALQL